MPIKGMPIKGMPVKGTPVKGMAIKGMPINGMPMLSMVQHKSWGNKAFVYHLTFIFCLFKMQASVHAALIQ